jgi:hypothetical protein
LFSLRLTPLQITFINDAVCCYQGKVVRYTRKKSDQKFPQKEKKAFQFLR